jgi:hypothetical protein
MEPFISPLNNFLDQVTRVLSNQITFSDNLKSVKKSVVISSAQTYPVELAYSLNEPPSLVVVGQIYATDGSVVAPYSFSWKLVNGTLHLTFSGLAATEHKTIICALV